MSRSAIAVQPEQLISCGFDPLDAIWAWLGVPEMKVGTLTLNRTPTNAFEETEECHSHRLASLPACGVFKWNWTYVLSSPAFINLYAWTPLP